jgi:predicted transporter
MKNLLKVTCYTLATAFVFVISQFSVLAAANTSNDSSLSGAQVIGGVAVLVAAILIPTMRSARKANANS